MATMQQQFDEAFKVANAILDVIKAAPNGIPSGELYAMVMDKIPIDTYYKFIQLLVDAKKITNTNHLLKAL